MKVMQKMVRFIVVFALIVNAMAFTFNAATSENLIPNWSADNGTDEWQTWFDAGSFSVEATGGADGSPCFHAQFAPTDWGAMASHPLGPVTKGETYVVTLKVKVTSLNWDAGGRIYINVQQYGSDDTRLVPYDYYVADLADISGIRDGKWVDVAATFTLNADNVGKLLIGVYGNNVATGDIYFDDFSVKKVNVGSVEKKDYGDVVNYIPENADAGMGAWSSWFDGDQGGFEVVANADCDGSAAFHAYFGVSQWGGIAFHEASGIEKGQKYTLTFRIRVADMDWSGIGGLNVCVQQYQANDTRGDDITVSLKDVEGIRDGDWVQATVSFTPTQDDVSKLRVGIQSTGKAVNVYFDDFFMVKGDLPTPPASSDGQSPDTFDATASVFTVLICAAAVTAVVRTKKNR